MTATQAIAHPEQLGGRDPEFVRRALPLLWPLVEMWFRPDIRGLELIPETGPVLLVGNHSGGNVSPDTTAFTKAFIRRFGAERPFFQLAHDLVMAAPQLTLSRRFGMIAASPANADAAFAQGAAVLVYPGGDLEVHRPVWHGHRVDLHGRMGWIRVALRHRVPIVPVVSIGGQETALFLGQGERLAHALTLDRRLRLHVLPVSIAVPWGLNVGDFLGHVPLPAKLQIEVLAPIDLADRYGEHPDVHAVYDDVVALMQRTLDGLAARRRWPVVG